MSSVDSALVLPDQDWTLCLLHWQVDSNISFHLGNAVVKNLLQNKFSFYMINSMCLCSVTSNSFWRPHDNIRLLCLSGFSTRMLGWVAISSSREYSRLRNQTFIFYVSFIGSWILYNWSILGSRYIDIDIDIDVHTNNIYFISFTFVYIDQYLYVCLNIYFIYHMYYIYIFKNITYVYVVRIHIYLGDRHICKILYMYDRYTYMCTQTYIYIYTHIYMSFMAS